MADIQGLPPVIDNDILQSACNQRAGSQFKVGESGKRTQTKQKLCWNWNQVLTGDCAIFFHILFSRNKDIALALWPVQA